MKKNLIILFSVLITLLVNGAEYAELPISVLMENEFENYDKDRVELEITVRDLEAKDKEILYLKNKVQDLQEENDILRKSKKRSKSKISPTMKSDKVILETNYSEYTKMVIRAGLKMGSTVDIQEADTGMGIKGDVEYIKGNMFFNGLELGAGLGFDYMAWENDNITTEGAIIIGEPQATTDSEIVRYDSTLMLVPLYLTAKYKMNSENKYLNGIYGFGKLGYNMGFGGDIDVSGGMYYGMGLGKNIGSFGAELEFISSSFSLDYAEVEYGEDFDATLDRTADITNSRISFNAVYNFDLDRFFK